MDFTKFLRTPFFKGHLWWLLLKVSKHSLVASNMNLGSLLTSFFYIRPILQEHEPGFSPKSKTKQAYLALLKQALLKRVRYFF